MLETDSDVARLVQRARGRDAVAREELLLYYHDRLRRMLAARLDERLASRLDPADVLQETFCEASCRLPDYLAAPRVPFYVWLRQLAWDKLVDAHRRHVGARKRSVAREEWLPSDGSPREAGARFVSRGGGPSWKTIRTELRDRLRQRLAELPAGQREVLVMQYFEQLSNREVAAALGVAVRTVQSRHRQALETLEDRLREDDE